MLMKQCVLKQDDGATTVGWIDKTHAVFGRRFDLNLGDGKRSPVVTVTEVWDGERDMDEIKERQFNQRAFGESIKT